MIRKLFFACLFVVLSACAPTVAGYRATVDTWRGHTLDDLVIAWGAPANTLPLNNGNTMVEYVHQDSRSTGGFNMYMPMPQTYNGTVNAYSGNQSATVNYAGNNTQWVPNYVPERVELLVCKTRFVVNPEGLILGADFSGNSCKAHPPTSVNGSESSEPVNLGFGAIWE